MSYLKTIFGVAGFVVLAVASVNFMANPLGIYNPPLIKGFNDAYPAATVYSRVEKSEAVKRLKPDVIITGSSRADIGLDPRPEFFPGLTVYNFGLSASSINEQRQALEFSEAVHPLKEAIITLDFFCFDGHKLENKQFDSVRMSPEAAAPVRAFFDTYSTLVSLDMLIASIKNMRYIKHLDLNSYSQPNGHRIISDVMNDVKLHGAAHMFEHPPAAQETNTEGFSFAYSDTPGDTTFKHLQEMLDFTRQHNIKVILLISPVHFSDEKGPQWQEQDIKEWKQRVAEIVRANGQAHGEKPYPLWDFSYSNSLTREPVPPHGDTQSQMKWFWDPGHSKTALGDIIFAKVLGLKEADKYPDFGKRLDQ
jgi:hypothetical protein